MTGHQQPSSSITHRTYARIGLFGNPSDQYFGKVVAFSLQNFHAEVTLTPSDSIRFIPHPVHDKRDFITLDALVKKVSTEGFYGSERLLMAACKAFSHYCAAAEIGLDRPGGFTLQYDTNIPRQLGLAGSSAIAYSALKCMMDFYGCSASIPPATRPGLLLAVEQELGITAGLQDRVIQVYGGLVYMDFDEQYMAEHGGEGRYSRLESSLLPPLHLMCGSHAKESGKLHSTVKARWQAGEPEARRLMAEVVECGECGRAALLARDHGLLAATMDRNFDLRRQLFGDAALGASNLRMMELARSVGVSVNFTGSGGALVAYCPSGDQQAARLRELVAAEGISMYAVQVAGPQAELA